MPYMKKKDGRLQIRISTAQTERYSEMAAREGFSASEWLRRLAERRAQEIERGTARPGDLPPAA
jgi:predicted HicB family RNase H-like nuclease